MRKSMFVLVLGLALLCVPAVFAADTYAIDAVHSNITFSVKHMMVSNVIGHFDKFEGTLAYSADDLANSKVTVDIPVSAINTANEKRDGHLKAEDFLDAAKFPNITFVSKTVTATTITGDLTIKGVTKEVSIPVVIAGPVKGMDGKDLIGINGSYVFNRQDFGISFNKTLDQGGLVVSNDISVAFSLEANKK